MTKQKRNHKRGSTLPGISEQPRLKPTALAVALAMLAMGSSQLYAAGPTGGAVVGGTGTITNPDANNTKIEQTSDRLAIEWASFNVSKDHTVQFAQPNSNAWVLNQINDTNPSLIEGNINANGRVILVNSNGLHFTSTAQVNVASLIASGHQLNTTDFMAKNSQLTANQTTGNGDVVNAGTIKAATGGTVTLLGKRIENTGKIFANAGQVNLAVGKTITLDFAGDNLLKFTITEALAENLETKSSAILNSNTGEINSESGSIIIEGKVASSVFDNVVNNQGLIRAKGISSSGGTIKLIGSGGSLSSVANTGELDASATSAGNNAGTVTLNAINSLLNLDDQSKIIVNSTDAKSGTINLLGNKINLSGNQIFTTGGAIDSKSDNLIIKATDSISQDTNAKINIITNQSGIILEAVNKITLDGGITTNNGNIKIETTAATSSILGKGDLSGNEVTLNSAGEIAVEGEIAGSKVLLEAKGSLGTSDTLRIKTKTNNLGVFSDDVAWISNTSTDETTLVANTTGSFNFINTGHNITIDKIKNSSGTEKKGITAEKVLMGLSAGLTLNEAINTTGTISIEATGTITTKASIKSSNNEINLKASTFELNLGEINSGTGGLKMEATSTANAATIINQDSGQGGIIANNLLLIISGTGTARNINLGSSSNSITRLAGNSSGTSGGGRNSAKLKLKNSKNLTIDKIGDVTGYQGEDVDIELIGLASKLEIKSNMDVHSLKVTGNFDLANNKELKASSLVITGTTNLAGDVTTTGTQTYTGAT
ncbi:filamentous hemagglutinin N-terminal domain-containing protein, partial [Marinospirillum minutulum]|uniref:two-partner secretion domain-containing protein n=1 Tax=Marinospirillum minutulum TaxID=64974 RepID=UPI0012EC1CDA